MDATITDQELTDFVRRAEEAATAYVQGDLDRYLDLLHHANGFTLLPPYGGPVSRHQERAAELRSWRSPFRDGEAQLEHVQTHAWGDTLVLVMIERQHARIGDPARPEHVAAGHPRVPPRRLGLATGTSSCRPARADHRAT